jgi:hypothetical protein
MELKPKPPTFRSVMFSAAVIFGGFAAVKLLHHDLYTGLWSFGVCLALVFSAPYPLGSQGPRLRDKIEPEEYSLLGE